VDWIVRVVHHPRVDPGGIISELTAHSKVESTSLKQIEEDRFYPVLPIR
jgi:hypothetical protein